MAATAPMTFTVPDLPTKKDGANSMWRKRAEVDRLIAPRLDAAATLGDHPPMAGPVAVVLEVHVGPTNSRAIGDLDNMITGVLDGLQRAAPGTPWDREPQWQLPEHAHIRPDTFAVIVDDDDVVEVSARKVMGDEEPWYRVVVCRT